MAFDQNNIDDLLKEAGLGEGEGGGEAAGGGAAPEGGAQAEADAVLGDAAASGAQPVAFQNLEAGGGGKGGAEDVQNLLGDVELRVQVVLGNSKMTVEEILSLADGSVVELDKLAGDPLDILVNNRLVAKGEVLVLNENFCIRITDIVPPDDRS